MKYFIIALMLCLSNAYSQEKTKNCASTSLDNIESFYPAFLKDVYAKQVGNTSCEDVQALIKDFSSAAKKNQKIYSINSAKTDLNSGNGFSIESTNKTIEICIDKSHFNGQDLLGKEYCGQLNRRFRIDSCREILKNKKSKDNDMLQAYIDTYSPLLNLVTDTGDSSTQTNNIAISEVQSELMKLRPTDLYRIATLHNGVDNNVVNRILQNEIIPKHNTQVKLEKNFYNSKEGPVKVSDFKAFNRVGSINKEINRPQVLNKLHEYLSSKPYSPFAGRVFEKLSEFSKYNDNFSSESFMNYLADRNNYTVKEGEAFDGVIELHPASIELLKGAFNSQHITLEAIRNNPRGDKNHVAKLLKKYRDKNSNAQELYKILENHDINGTKATDLPTEVQESFQALIDKGLIRCSGKTDRERPCYFTSSSNFQKQLARDAIEELKRCVGDSGALEYKGITTTPIIEPSSYLPIVDAGEGVSDKSNLNPHNTNGSLSSDRQLFDYMFKKNKVISDEYREKISYLDYDKFVKSDENNKSDLQCDSAKDLKMPEMLIHYFGFGDVDKQKRFFKNNCLLSSKTRSSFSTTNDKLSLKSSDDNEFFGDGLYDGQTKNIDAINKSLEVLAKNGKLDKLSNFIKISGSASVVPFNSDKNFKEQYSKDFNIDQTKVNDLNRHNTNALLAISRGIIQMKLLSDRVSKNSNISDENKAKIQGRLKIPEDELRNRISKMYKQGSKDKNGSGLNVDAIISALPKEFIRKGKTNKNSDLASFDFKVQSPSYNNPTEAAKNAQDGYDWHSPSDMKRLLHKVYPREVNNIKTAKDVETYKAHWKANRKRPEYSYESVYQDLRSQSISFNNFQSETNDFKVGGIDKILNMANEILQECQKNNPEKAYCEYKYDESGNLMKGKAVRQ